MFLSLSGAGVGVVVVVVVVVMVVVGGVEEVEDWGLSTSIGVCNKNVQQWVHRQEDSLALL